MTRELRVQLILFAVIAIVTSLRILNSMAYVVGLYHLPLLLLPAAFPIYGGVVVAVGCLVYQVYRLFRSTAEGRLLRAGVVIGSAIVLLSGLLLYRPWYVMYTVGFRQRMHRIGLVEELPAIRQWIAQQEIPGESSPISIPLASCPPAIKRLGSDNVWLANLGWGDEVVKGISVGWGGAFFGGWGLTIGPETMGVPEASKWECILPLDSGAYVYYNIR